MNNEFNAGMEQVATPKKKSKTKAIIIAIVVLLILGGGAFYLFLGGGMEQVAPKEEPKDPASYVTAMSDSWSATEGGKRQYTYSITLDITPEEWMAMSVEEQEALATSIVDAKKGDFEVTGDDKYFVVAYEKGGAILFTLPSGDTPFVYPLELEEEVTS